MNARVSLYFMKNTQYLAKIEAAKKAVEELKHDKTLPNSRIQLGVNLEVALLEMEVMLRTHFLQANTSVSYGLEAKPEDH